MSDLDSPDAVMISTALARLENPSTDEYVVAFGPSGRQFFATPSGYVAVQLPTAVLSHISSKPVRKITRASYGSHPDSWFFAYEMVDGSFTFQVGAGIPLALQHFIERVAPTDDLRSDLRVRLGDRDSFVAWARTSWACYGIPCAVEAELCQLSSAHMKFTGITKGSLKGNLIQVVWHSDGTYFIEAQQGYFWNFDSSITHSAWIKLWLGRTAAPSLTELSELLVVLDSHTPVAETFAFIKKQHGAKEAPFVIHVYQDTTHTAEALELEPAPGDQHVHDTRLQHLELEPEKPRFFQWAVSKHAGQPHPKDSWELNLKKGQKVKVWEDRGNSWYMVEGGGLKGWVHGTWLAFCGNRVHKDPRNTYSQFQDDMPKLLVPGQLCDFPPLREYMAECVNAACQPLRDSTQLGVCVHNLQTLLEGSGQYSYNWLKEERNVWHPDKFARYCHLEHKERLKTSAQEVFVLYGILMDVCKQQEAE